MIHPTWNGQEIPDGVCLTNIVYVKQVANKTPPILPKKIFVEKKEKDLPDYYILKDDEFVVARAVELIQPKPNVMNVLAHIKRGQIEARYMLVKDSHHHPTWKYILTLAEIERVNRDGVMIKRKCGPKNKKLTSLK